jgi:hypothetical protein
MTAILVHELPCRLRFRVQCLKHDNQRAERLCGRIAAVPGVVAASASPLTGSVVVTHDGHTATRERIVRTLGDHGYPVVPGLPTAALSGAAAAARMEVHPLLRIVTETLLEQLLHTALAAMV